MTFARLVLAATTNDPLPESPQARLPARPTAHAIIQYYMSNIYSLFPSFQETALYTALDDLYQEDDRVIKDSDCWMVYMVLAIGSTAQSRRYGDEYYTNGLEFVSRAMSYADGAFTPGYVTLIQSLLLLTQYSMLDPAHFDSWHLIGFTARAIVDLGFHQDPPMSSVSDKSALDMRRKIFYCVYALDRFVTLCPRENWQRLTWPIVPSVWFMLGRFRSLTIQSMLHSLNQSGREASLPAPDLSLGRSQQIRHFSCFSSDGPSLIGTRNSINQVLICFKTPYRIFGKCAST